MKRITKIAVLALAIALLVAAFALIASAEDSGAIFTVNGKASEKTTLADAITEAGKGGTVKINADIEISATISVSNSVKIDLNGHEIVAKTGARHFDVKSGATLEICGEGALSGAPAMLYINDGGETVINAYGKGIDIKGLSGTTWFNGIWAKPGSKLAISGTVNFYPICHNTNGVILVGDKDTSTVVQKTATAVIDSARIIIHEPDAQYKYKKSAFPYAMDLRDGADVTVKDSVINSVHGNAIKFTSFINALLPGTGSGSKVTALDEGKKLGDFRIYLDIDNSEVMANNSGYQRAVDTSGYSVDAGYLFNTNRAPAKVTVDNSTLVGANRTISGGYTAYDKYEISNTYFYFNNVDFRTNENPMYKSGWLVAYKNNVIWNGGVITLYCGSSTLVGTLTSTNSDPFSDEVKKAATGFAVTDDLYVNITANKDSTYTYNYYKMEKQKYSEIGMACTAYSKHDTNGDGDSTDAEDWSGVLFRNVYFETCTAVAIADSLQAAAKPTFSIEGSSIYYNVYKQNDVFGAHLKKYASAYLTPDVAAKAVIATPVGNSVDTDYTGRFTSVYNPTVSYHRVKNGTQIGILTEAGVIASERNYGITEQVASKDGKNGFFRFSIPNGHSSTSTSTPYLELDVGSYASGIKVSGNKVSPATPSSYSLDKYKYAVQEFDIATESGAYPKFNAAVVFRYTSIAPGADGAYSYTDADQPQYSFCPMQITANGKLNTWSNNNNLVCEKTSNTVTLTTDGSWNRISIVYELGGWNEAESYTFGSETRQCASFKANMHVYVNGEWFCSYNGIMDESKKIDTDLMSTFILDAFRFTSSTCDVGTSLLIDNTRVSFYQENASLASLAANYKNSIKENSELMLMPRNEDIVGTVDGEIYYTEKDLNSAIKPGSFVDLAADIKTDITATNKNFTVKLNGHSVSGIVSATNKALYYGDYISVVPAGDDVYKIVFANPDVTPAIPETTVYAALGTKAVSGIDLSSYTSPVLVGGKNVYFDGWTFEGGNEILLVTPSYDTDGDKKIYAIPVYADAAVVEWYDGDGNLLATEDYRPGAGVYSGVFAPETALPTKLTNHAWYDLAYAGYSAVELPESGVYKVYPDYVAIAKDGVPANIKLNLTLYTNYELNIFVPLADLADYADSIRIVRLDGASNEIAVGSLGECTVYGAPYIKFADAYGVADISLNTYRIYYTVGGVLLSKDIKYSVPRYASQVMQTSTNEEAKALVMNMVNYANTIIKYLSTDVSDVEGAKIYKALLSHEAYKSYVRTYDDSEFLAGGSIYKNEISKLTYDDKNEEEPLKAPSTWIASAGFYFSTNRPTFYVKFSETAENTENGIKKPNSSGSYGWAKVGLFVYMGVTGEDARPGRMYARYDDTGANAYNDWNNREKNGNISYYTVAVTETVARNPLHLYNMAEVININISSRDGTNSGANEVGYPEQGDGVKATYSLSAYIYEMLTAANAEGVSAEDKAEYLAGAEMAKALYAYAKVTREYVY